MRILGLTFVCCVLLAVASCKESQSQYKDAIVGRWQLINGPGSVEFAKDGKASLNGVEGTYRLDGKDNVTITTNESFRGATRFTAKVSSITGNEMTLTDPDGTVSKWKRQ
ncbi:MAG: hypothetical protein HYS12_00495 [Planctomycetes bacterium]|nr:hypothetical protein [Planctomycetota bacterium]